MGGVGIRAMGRLMERVMAHIDVTDAEAVKKTEQELQHVAAACRWTRGTWPELGLPWDELQNTPRHISALSNFLARTYVTNRMAAR
jgi:hypothetical protein